MNMDALAQIGVLQKQMTALQNKVRLLSSAPVADRRLSSTVRGQLAAIPEDATIPQISTTTRDALEEVAEGYLIFNTTTKKYNFMGDEAWEEITSVAVE